MVIVRRTYWGYRGGRPDFGLQVIPGITFEESKKKLPVLLTQEPRPSTQFQISSRFSGKDKIFSALLMLIIA